MNYRTPSLVAKHGFAYESGLMDSDHPYRHATGLVELPMHWSLDDWNRYNYVPGYASSPILRPSDVVEAWDEELEAIVAVGGLFDLTMHPFISGRPARAAALETLIRRAQAMDGVWVAAGDEIAAWVAGLDLPPVDTARAAALLSVGRLARPRGCARRRCRWRHKFAPVRRPPSTPMTLGGITQRRSQGSADTTERGLKAVKVGARSRAPRHRDSRHALRARHPHACAPTRLATALPRTRLRARRR